MLFHKYIKHCLMLGLVIVYGVDLKAQEFGLGYEPDDWPIPTKTAKPKRALLSSAQNAVLPSKYDSRDYGLVTPVKNQGSYGTCWTFSSICSLEASIIKAGYPVPDLSEHNLANLHGWDSSPIAGGNDTKASAYFLRWCGAVPEASDPYPESGSTITTFGTSVQRSPSYHVQNVVMVPARESATDNEGLKKAIMDYGVLSAHFYITGDTKYRDKKTGAYYGNFTNGHNHAVSLIGWDDEYSRDNFPTTPPGDGAWLIKNSHGSTIDDAGFMHISYYDTSFAYNASAAFIVAAEDENYTGVYGYDVLGRCNSRGTGVDGCLRYGAAVFTAIGNEDLAAVGFYVITDATEYQISVYTNCNTTSPISGVCVVDEQTGVSNFAGFKTIHLESPVRLAKGTRFSIVVGCSCPTYGYPIAYEWAKDGASGANAKSGQTYYGTSKTSWKDFTSYKATASFCCKAYVKAVVDDSDNMDRNTMTPGEDLTSYVNWLNNSHNELWWQSSGTGGAMCDSICVNGSSLFSNFVCGVDPYSEDEEFKISISMDGTNPIITWEPDLKAERNYEIYGTSDLSLSSWHAPTNSYDRFFKVKVSLPE